MPPVGGREVQLAGLHVAGDHFPGVLIRECAGRQPDDAVSL